MGMLSKTSQPLRLIYGSRGGDGGGGEGSGGLKKDKKKAQKEEKPASQAKNTPTPQLSQSLDLPLVIVLDLGCWRVNQGTTYRIMAKKDAQPQRYTSVPICFIILVHLVVPKDAGKSLVKYEELVPLPSHEKNSDLVRYRAVRYEPDPEIWQKVACAWDQFQTRPNQFHQYESDSLFPAIPTSTVR